MTPKQTIQQNILRINQRIQNRLAKNHRGTDEALLLAVSKKHPPSAINSAYEAGQRDFGENYLQEALAKIEDMPFNDIVWHFIGPIQSNKTKAIAENFHWAHSVDRLKIAQRLSDQRPKTRPPINVCIQVNIDNEPTKSGALPTELPSLIEQCHSLPNIHVRGLMCIPSPQANIQGDSFRKLAQLFSEISAQFSLPHWDTLSMGMSSDLELAIDHGATIVRIGTDIFGPRE